MVALHGTQVCTESHSNISYKRVFMLVMCNLPRAVKCVGGCVTPKHTRVRTNTYTHTTHSTTLTPHLHPHPHPHHIPTHIHIHRHSHQVCWCAVSFRVTACYVLERISDFCPRYHRMSVMRCGSWLQRHQFRLSGMQVTRCGDAHALLFIKDVF